MNKKRWDELVQRVDRTRPIIGAEIGVWEGAMSHRVLTALPNLTLLLVDRWRAPEKGDSFYGSGSKIATWGTDRHEAAMATARKRLQVFDGRVRFLRGDSTAMAKLVSDATLDFVFIDGDHSFEGVMADLHAWVPKVKRAGLIGGHDIDRPEKGGVTKAVETYFKGVAVERGSNSTWWIGKV